MDRLRHWAMGRISKLLGYEDNGAMTDYFLNANDRDQLFEYAGEVLGMEEKAQKFITELWERIEAARDQSKTKTRQHKKKEDDFYEFFPGAVAQKKKSRNRSRSRSRSPAAREEKGRVKVTYVKSKKKEQRRIPCSCQSMEHPLFTNCQACGKIICEQEGEGPCFFCGSHVTKHRTIISQAFEEIMNIEDNSKQIEDYTAQAHTQTQKQRQFNFSSKGASSSSSSFITTKPGKSRNAKQSPSPSRNHGGRKGRSRSNVKSQTVAIPVSSSKAKTLTRKHTRAQAAPKPAAKTKAETTKKAPTSIWDMADDNDDADSTDVADVADGEVDEAELLRRAKLAEEKERERAYDANLEKAVNHKNKLLQFAETKGKRTNIIDDQCDYYDFESNIWMTKEEKKQAKAILKQREEEKEKKRKQNLITLDFSGSGEVIVDKRDEFGFYVESKRRVVDDPNHTSTFGRGGKKSGSTSAAANQNQDSSASAQASQFYANDTLTGRAKRVYDDLKEALRSGSTSLSGRSKKDGAGTSGRGDADGKRLVNAKLGSFQSRIQDDDRFDDSGGQDGDKKDHDNPPTKTKTLTSIWGGDSSDDDDGDDKQDADTEVEGSQYPASSDKGMCLSMHQPWASLLVYGIKRFEGRGWSHNHRGRLWIASTAQEPDELEIQALEEEYRALYSDELDDSAAAGGSGGDSGNSSSNLDTVGFSLADLGRKHGGGATIGTKRGNSAGDKNKIPAIPFPKSYPKSALLGCVDMVDCAPNDDFQLHRRNNPHLRIMNSISKYLFVCTNPRALRLPFQIRGNHKMWKLPPLTKEGAQQQLRPISTKWLAARTKASGAATEASKPTK